jgi:hypothetical protein
MTNFPQIINLLPIVLAGICTLYTFFNRKYFEVFVLSIGYIIIQMIWIYLGEPNKVTSFTNWSWSIYETFYFIIIWRLIHK